MVIDFCVEHFKRYRLQSAKSEKLNDIGTPGTLCKPAFESQLLEMIEKPRSHSRSQCET